MKKAIWNISMYVLIFIVGFAFGVMVQLKTPASKQNTDMSNMGFKKQTQSEVTSQYTYTSNNGADTIKYYCIKTTYYEADPQKITGLNTDAFRTMFDPETAENSEEMMIQDWYGCLYTFSKKAYLCWTMTPYTSYILEYNPETVSKDDIIRMAESVKTQN